MTDLWPFIDAAIKYLILPGGVWIYSLHKGQMALQTEVAVLKAEASARDKARKEEREATAKQLDQILSSINTLSGRIDAMMKDR